MAHSSVRAAEWAAAITRLLPRFVWEIDPIVQAKRQGVLFTLDLRDNVQRTFYFTGWYERRYIEYLIQALRRGDVFVDVGAHVGIHSICVSRAMQAQDLNGHVFAFEPASDVCRALREAVRMNELHNIRVLPTALGAKTEHMDLRSDPERFHEADASVRSAFSHGEVVERVPVVSFDDWSASEDIACVDIIKIDVEGYELEILHGMEETLLECRPRIVGVEIRDYILERSGVSRDEVVHFLDQVGYRRVETEDLEGNFIFQPVEYARNAERDE
jgi:FkbM family methyltransferase